MIELETARMFIREVTEDELAKVLPVYKSNPEILKRMEGSEGEIGRYDLERWQRDWQIAQMMPGRHMLACYLKENGEPVGYIDYIEENDDGIPFLGQLMISKAYQRQSLGSEAFACLIAYGRRQYSWTQLRTWVLEENASALAFLQHLGFQPLEQGRKQWRLPGGMQPVIVLERTLTD